MAANFPKIIDKLLDNANLGKVITDVGAGFALSLSLLMMVGLTTGMSVIPADRIHSLNSDIVTQYEVVQREMSGFCRTLEDPQDELCQQNATQNRTIDNATLLSVNRPPVYFEARQSIASLASEVDGLQKRIETESNRIANIDEDKISGWVEDIAGITAPLDALITQRDSIDEEIQRLETLINEFNDARSLEANLAVLGNHITEMLAISVILGLLLSQVNRLIFIRGIYDTLLQKMDNKYAETRNALVALGDQDTTDQLVSQYYRYTEGAINLVAPVVLFGWYFPRYANTKLSLESGDISSIGFLVGSLALAVLLIVSGFFTYRSFREKGGEIAQLREKRD